MRKYLFAAIMLLTTLSAFAQTETNLGFTLGFAEPIERYRSGYNSGKTDLDKKNVTDGLKLGLICETTIVKGFGVAIGLNYGFGADVNKWVAKPGMTAIQTKKDHFFHYLEIPVDWQYRFMIAKKTYLSVYSGPTLTCGIANKYRVREKIAGEMRQDEMVNVYQIDDDKDDIRDYNRVNVTWGLGLGFQYERYFIRGGYNFGIMSTYKDAFHNAITSNPYEYNNRGRLDTWELKLGIYLWQFK